jgi:hypothetical protein
MAKNIRLGIIRARHDASVAVIPDPACLKMVFTGDHALVKYWHETTARHLDFLDSPMFPWVDITLGADTSRGAQAKAAIDAVRARFPDPPPLDGLDGLVVLTHPGTRTMPNPQGGQPGQPATITRGFDGGSTSVAGFPVAVLPVMASDHTFMCHEIGHVLGFEHSFGLDNNGTDWDPNDATIIVGPEYGSPYCLMSSASFGSRWLGTGPFYSARPTFVGPPVAGWPYAGAFSMGPHLARATLHLRMPEALAGRVIDVGFPQPGGILNARIVPASAATGRCLLILRPPGEPPNGVGRVYVEYRTLSGWDRGMDPLGPDLARIAVVVHSAVDQPNAGPRAFYRGAIPNVSVDRDLAIPGTSLVIRAVNAGDDGVDLTVTTGAARGVEIVRGNHSDDMVGVVGELENTTTLCGDPVRRGTFATSTFSQFGVRTSGFGGGGQPGNLPAVVRWTVAGVPVSGTNGTANIPVGDVSFTIEFTIDPVVFELALTSRGGERYEVPVVVTVTGDGATATAAGTFTALGWFEGIHPEDQAAVGKCLKGIADRYRVLPTVFRKPTPEPVWGSLLLRRQTEQLWLARTMRFIDEMPTLDAEAQDALRRMVQLQVQAAPSMLDRLASVGIDFSVPESDITDWLNNPEFTPYPALAEALFRLLGTNVLARPVFMDVIAFNYENSQGQPSPRRVEDVNPGALEAAVLEGSNVRYGGTVSDFRQLLVSGL